MKTEVAENKKTNTSAFVNGNMVDKENVKPQQPEGAKLIADKAEQPKANVSNAESLKAAQPQLDAVKAEATKAEAVKPVMNLENTLKLVEEMHRRIKQRSKLLETINNLEGFQVELKEEADTTDTNYYTGCLLTIEDDKRNQV
jgi:hypothetical protein